MVQLENNTVSVEAEATHIPESVSVSVEGMEEGTQVHAGELKLPAGSTLVSVPEMLILSIQQPPKAEEETPVVAEESDATAAGDSEDSGANAGGE